MLTPYSGRFILPNRNNLPSLHSTVDAPESTIWSDGSNSPDEWIIGEKKMYQDHSQYQRDSLGQDKAKEDGQTRPKPVIIKAPTILEEVMGAVCRDLRNPNYKATKPVVWEEKSFMSLINAWDNVPCLTPEPMGLNHTLGSFWTFHQNEDLQPLGLIAESTVKRMTWSSDFLLKSESKQVCLLPGKDSDFDHKQAMNNLLSKARDDGLFPSLLRYWKNETCPVIGAQVPFSIERAASLLFGIVIRGAHLVMYTKTPMGTKIWVPRRALTRSEYPGQLDTTAGGGVATGETPLECVAREASEEASLSEALVLQGAVAYEPLRWCHLDNEEEGGERNLLIPCAQYVFDLEVGADVVPKAVVGEFEEFYLLDARQVEIAIRKGEFKPSCGLVMIDWLIRHGFVAREGNKEFDEVVRRLRRDLTFFGCSVSSLEGRH